MMRFVKFIIISFLVFFGSGLSTLGHIKNPCRSGDFLKDLEKFSKSELIKLEQKLKSASYDQSNQDGCRDALLGRINEAKGSMSDASQYFSMAMQKMPELEPYFMLAKAGAELKNRDYLQAKQIATALLNSKASIPSTKFHARIQQILSEVALFEKDHHQVIKTHQELIARGYGDQEALLFNLGTSLGIMGEHQKSDDIFKQLLIRHPSSNQAQHVLKMNAMAKIHLDVKESEARFDKLIENLAFDQVVLDVDKTLNNKKIKTNPDEESALHSFAVKSLMLSNQFEKGIKRAQSRALRKNATPRDLESYAWSLAKVDRFIEAADYYRQFSNKAISQADKAKGCFFAGFSLYEASLYSLAQLSFQGCHELMDKSPYQENYLWYQALSAMLTSDFYSVHRLLTELIIKFKKSPDSDKYTYFLAYSLHQIHKKNEGDKVYRKLASLNKPTYYAILARQALGLKAPIGKNIGADALAEKASSCKSATCANSLTLYHLGFRDEARELILNGSDSMEEKLALLQNMGLYHDAWQRSHTVKPEILIQDGAVHADAKIRISYPVPYQAIINEMSRKYSVKKSLLYAIIRAESGFLHDAKSYRGALGLMQMMPFVAEDLASKIAIDKFSSDQLKEPKVAIELGTIWLAILKRQFDTMHLIVAAYNAGPHQVQKWLDRFGHLPAELFIERIPFKQTRDYVKKVLPSESLYFALQGQPLKLAL